MGSKTPASKLSYGPLRWLHQAAVAPLHSHLPQGGALIMAPFGDLHLLPFGAALDPDSGRYASEDYKLAFAPSLSALRVARDEEAQRQASSPDRRAEEHLLSVAYPDEPGSKYYLPNVLPEAQAVARHFTVVTPLYREEATPEAVRENARGQEVVHLGCHGEFVHEDPEQSGLVLSAGRLTVRRIVTELHLEQTKLATIGACLSGRVAVRRGEEHVGLVQAVMSAGASGVVASLWPVEDASTRALFELFYAGVAAADSAAEALADAASLLRSRPGWEHPYYWAAFQANGLTYDPNGTKSAHRSSELLARVEEARRESVHKVRRGGHDAIMNVENTAKDSIVLLEQMADEPEMVLEALDPTQREKVMEALSELAGQAEGVRTEEGLLALIDNVYRLIGETPPLAAFFEGASLSRIKPDQGARSAESQHAQKYAAQIHNRVVECRQALEQALARPSPTQQRP